MDLWFAALHRLHINTVSRHLQKCRNHYEGQNIMLQKSEMFASLKTLLQNNDDERLFQSKET